MFAYPGLGKELCMSKFLQMTLFVGPLYIVACQNRERFRMYLRIHKIRFEL